MNSFNRILSSATVILAAVALSAAGGPSASAPVAEPNTVRRVTPIPIDQDPVSLARPSFHIYTDADGLPQMSVSAIARDTRGYLWVATQEGAAYFNGRTWTAVNMPDRLTSNYVDTLAASRDGSMLFGTDRAGLCRLTDGQWTTTDTDDGLPGNSVHAIIERTAPDGGTVLWVGTDKGLARIEGGKITSYDVAAGLADLNVISLAVSDEPDGSESVWVGTQRGLSRLAHGTWTTYSTASGLQNDDIMCIYQGPAENGTGRIWVGNDNGLCWFDGKEFHPVAGLADRQDLVIRTIHESVLPNDKHVLWVGLVRGGLGRFEDGMWTFYDAKNGLSTNEVSTLFETQSESGMRTLWIGLNGGGLARMDYGTWRQFDVRSGLPNKSMLSYLDAENPDGTRTFYLGTRSGLARYDHGKWVVTDMRSGLPSLGIRAIVETTDGDGSRTLWVGTTKGLAKYERGRWSVMTTADGLVGDEILCMRPTVDEAGRPAMWICTGSGLSLMHGGVFTNFTASNGLPHPRCQAIVETRGPSGSRAVWVATDAGLAVYENDTWRVFTSKDGLANDTVLNVLVEQSPDGPVLWAGTFGGVSFLELDHPERGFTSLSDTTEPRLPNNSIWSSQIDASGRIYLCTIKGVSRLTRRTPTPEDPSRFSIYTFTTDDGLPANECDIGASMVDSAGRVWVGTVGGTAVFDPAEFPEDTTPKPLRVERALVDGKPRALGAGTPLRWDENNLVIEYALLSFYRDKDSRFRTELVGIDHGPSAWTADAKRDCSNLPPGDYSLRIWGRDYAGNVSGPTIVGFRITPAPWRTWWAYLIYILAIAAVIWLLVRMRVRALKRHNVVLEEGIRERTTELAEKVELLRASEQKAKDASRAKSVFLASMSHELRTPLNAILGFVQLMERKSSRGSDDREHLSIIARSGEHLLSLINDVLSLSKIEAGQLTLNERSFDLPLLLRNVEEMFRLRAQAKALQLIVDVDPNLPLYVTGDDGKLRQILINLLANSFKFTDAGGVALRVKWHGGVCFFEVEDTGQGIAPEEMDKLFEAFVQTSSGQRANEGTGLGLAISRNYVQLMGGEMSVASEVGKGSRFSFHLPLELAVAPDPQYEEMQVVGLETNQPAYRVLVVDDRWENRRLLSQLLSSVGFQTREASNGAEAVDTWSKWPAEIVLMDIHMPVLDGYEATRRIRALEAESGAKTVCILAVTASAFAQERDLLLEAGCDDFVSKPFRNSTVFEKLAEHAGVRFVYDRLVREDSSSSAGGSSVTPDRLAALPSRLLEDLNQAVVQGDIERSLRLVDEIKKLDGPLGTELHLLVRAYRFDDILDRVGR